MNNLISLLERLKMRKLGMIILNYQKNFKYIINIIK